jgi:hypothetical protein
MLTALALAAAALAAGCGGAGDGAANTAPPGAAPGDQGYEPAPEVLAAMIGPAGRITLAGEAPGGAVVRVASPAGLAQFATADSRGAWRMIVPASAVPQLFGLSMSDRGRVTEAQGYLFVAPDGVVARLRAGGGSEVLGARSPGLVALALDYDNRRAAALSGLGTSGEAESLRVDGVERGQTTTDAAGRFVLPLNEPLGPGPHDFDLAGARREVRFSSSIDAPAPLGGAPFASRPIAQGWRIDWTTPGGGEQTTLVLDALAPAP